MDSKSTGIIIAIAVSAFLISGSLVFLGTQIQKGTIDPQTVEKMKEFLAMKAGEKETDQPRQEFNAVKTVDGTKDHVLGNKDALISVIEYSDFECPFCKRAHTVFQRVVDFYGGKVNWVYRHFPLNFHEPVATEEALASECAASIGGNDAFWKYSDLVFQKTKSNGSGIAAPDTLITLAKQVGLNQTKFQKCLDNKSHQSRILQDISEGSDAGVTGTPGNFVLNNKTQRAIKIPGAESFEVFQRAITQLLDQ